MECHASHDHHDHDDARTRARQRLADLTGPRFWRSLEEYAATPEFRRYVEREFPAAASEWKDEVSRRTFLRLMSASLALAGIGVGAGGGCNRQDEAIIPYVVPPENLVPGVPKYFATAMPLGGGYALGLLAENHNGRPTKLEGNPDHPASLGATDVHAQASILSLYDPDRAQTITRGGQVATWQDFLVALRQAMAQQQARGSGAGLRLLTGAVTSPTLIDQIQSLLKAYPKARWHQYEPVCGDGERQGAIMAFGRPVNTVYRFDRARRILSLDSDFLLFSPGVVRYNRDFANARRVRIKAPSHGAATQAATQPHGASTQPSSPPNVDMHRVYAVESTATLTGAMADHRLPMPAREIEAFARAVLREVTARAGGGDSTPATTTTTAPTAPSGPAQFAAEVARDLLQHRGRSVVVPGQNQSPAVHAIAHALNDALGAQGETLVYTEPVAPDAGSQVESLRALVNDMVAGRVELLVMIDVNPIFTAPANFEFVAAMEKVPLRISHSEYYDETGMYAHWHVPLTHYLEMWSDLRAFDGTATIVQPLIAPLYQSRSPHELVSAMAGETDLPPREIVRRYWRTRAPKDADFEVFWRNTLEKGAVESSAAPVVRVTLKSDALTQPATSPATQSAAQGMELNFRPDAGVYDGRFANNGWLQELPRPITKLTWDNVALLSPATARRLGVRNEDVVTLRFHGRQVDAPVWVQPGQPDDAVTVQLGFGRTRAGRVGTGAGFDAYAIRTADAMWFGDGLEITKTGRRYPLACTQPHQAIHGRDIVRVHSLDQLIKQIAPSPASQHPAAEGGGEPGGGYGTNEDRPTARPGRSIQLSLYPPMPGSDGENIRHAWGMAIDTNLCTGCSACVVACQAENNIPVVGKDQVRAQREMHWLRIDTYFAGSPQHPSGPIFEPMLCQHCEKAPCEYVCPVEATTHSAEGINEMTYNRCIGTRYCSNNCPYKVRRFNFLSYTREMRYEPVVQLRNNPDVTVRGRGVMEKCTFCVQRVNATRRDIKVLQSRETGQDAETVHDLRRQQTHLLETLTTACAQACPTQAIVFGDLLHKTADGRPMEVVRMKEQPHAFGVLTELNTGPRVSYLARLTNPNPALEPVFRELSPAERTQLEEAKG